MLGHEFAQPVTTLVETLQELGPGFHRDLTVEIDDRVRRFSVYIPPQFYVDRVGMRHGFLAFDEYALGVEESNRMPITNRLNDTAKKYGLLAIYPQARRRFFGLAQNIWSAKHTVAPYHPGFHWYHEDDLRFVRHLKWSVQMSYNLTIDTAIGFGVTGGNFVHRLAEKDILNAVAVCSTWMNGQPLPQRGAKALIFLGSGDRLLPPIEGRIRGNWQQWLTALLLWQSSAVFTSSAHPQGQIHAYQQANGVRRDDTSDATLGPKYNYVNYGNVVFSWTVHEGHRWWNPEWFDINEAIAHTLGWADFVPYDEWARRPHQTQTTAVA